MKITPKTKTKMVLPLITDDNFEPFIEQVPEVPLDTKVTDMTIGEFEDAITDTNAYIARFMSEPYALIAFGKMKTFQRELTAILKYIDSLSVEGDDREKTAAAGIEWPSLGMRMRLDLCENLHLHDLKDAEQKEVWQWIAFEQRKSCTEQYNRRYAELKK